MISEKNKEIRVLQNKKDNTLLVWLNRIENGFVVLLLTSILLFAMLQIILRNFFDAGLIWNDSLLRILVLWLALAGAIVATREGKQISIDVLSQYIPDRYKKVIKNVNLIFTVIVCFIVSYFSFQFVRSEFLSGQYAFAKVPIWLTEAIIPVGFAFIGVKYIVQLLNNNKNS